LDVHPPHEPIHSWRDFFVHLSTITVGLLIALGLENAVESLHHRDIVSEARENIRREIEQNQEAVKEDLTNLDANENGMKANLAVLRTMEKNPKDTKKHLSYLFDWSTFNESAWLSARDSGALTYMPTDEVQHYADVYDAQGVVTHEATDIFISESEDYAPFMMEEDGSLTPQELRGVMRDTAVTYARLQVLRQIVDQLGKHYAETLKK